VVRAGVMLRVRVEDTAGVKVSAQVMVEGYTCPVRLCDSTLELPTTKTTLSIGVNLGLRVTGNRNPS